MIIFVYTKIISRGYENHSRLAPWFSIKNKGKKKPYLLIIKAIKLAYDAKNVLQNYAKTRFLIVAAIHSYAIRHIKHEKFAPAHP